jgi:hypothetical protein
MLKTINLLVLILLMTPFLCRAQKSAEFNPNKQGKWILNQYSMKEADLFHKNVKVVAEWFHRQVPIMASLKGFDLWIELTGYWDEKYRQRPCNYGRRGELNFNFQLFASDAKGGGKWTVEPPHWSFDINNTETGHQTLTRFVDFDNTIDPASMEKPLNKAAAELNDLFLTHPFKKEIAPGIRLYGWDLIVFNPDRPPFWVPVTVREVAEAKLEYYKYKEVHLLPYLKEEIAKLTEKELNTPAYSGNQELFVLNVHAEPEDKSNEEGGQIMRFNPDYWDRSLPPTAIQFITLWYPQLNQSESDEYFNNNGYPHFAQLIMNSFKLEELSGLIMRNK